MPPTDTPVPPTATKAQPTTTPSQVPTQSPTAKVVIVKVFNSGRQEYVEIVNQGSAPQNLGGWTVSGSKGPETFRFPDGYVLEAGANVRLHSGENGVDAPPTDIYWTVKNVWNNDGETVYLKDTQGNLVDEYKY
jgi:competence protein ComEC